MQPVRSVVRALGALAAVLLAGGGPLVAGIPSAEASAGQLQQRSSGTGSAVSQPLTISITGMTPAIALPNATVTVTGTLANHTGAALPGIVVQALTSTSGFGYPAQMTQFTSETASGASPLLLQQAGQYSVPNAVPNGASVNWSVSFPAGVFYAQFGVFPVQVQAQVAGIADAAARTFLPFWPGSQAAAQTKGLQVAWVWPLIGTPQQGACPQTLATSGLGGSVASGGRLSTLLDAGSTWAQTDNLTWDIDPALLSDVSVMTKTYFTQGLADCTDRFRNQPSTAASTWLAQLKTSTAGAPAFLTPYGNVDVAALSHAGLDTNVQAAYQVGETVAGQILPNTFGKTGTGTGDGQVLKAAWPANGQADAGVLTSLAHYDGISTVVLSSNEVSSPSSRGEDALARTVSGLGASMSVLVANARITSLLGTASASASPASQFTLTQDFLAQTAMIAAEYDTKRSLVVAPPPNWDPSPAEANALLLATHQAPWLHSTTLSALSSAAAALPSATQVQAKHVSSSELSDAYVDNVAAVTARLTLFEDLLYRPAAQQVNSLNAALAVTESAAWRGSGLAGGWRAAGQLTQYLKDAEHKVQLIASKKILLTGQSGKTAVSVLNGLQWAIQVKVKASAPTGSGVQVGPFDPTLTVAAGGSGTVTMPVQSTTLGTTMLRLQLATPKGDLLTWTKQPLSVEVTRFGRSLLIVIGGALGILVLTSAYRLRRKRLAGARNDGTAERTDG
ncbi:MAG TPA: DUF6049 family protein [Trebonia sp.]|nr:DUF6049 family protein [Trebonia sp.]